MENPKEWPEDTEFKTTEDGKKEIVLPEPTNMAEFDRQQRIEERGKIRQENKQSQTIDGIKISPQKRPNTKESYKSTKEKRIQSDNLENRRMGKRSQEKFISKESNTENKKIAREIKNQAQSETPWWLREKNIDE